MEDKLARHLHKMIVRFCKDEGIEKRPPDNWEDLRETAKTYYQYEARQICWLLNQGGQDGR